jgi:uracil-DNA glycosylase
MAPEIERLLEDVRRCTVCAPYLSHAPRPVLQFSAAARLVIIGQAPGSRVHASGMPWADDSGDRLREWTGLDPVTFYDPERVALMPMGFCYPGAANGADLPPRPECAPLWHARLLVRLKRPPPLTLLVGIHAQGYYLRATAKKTMTDTVRAFADYAPAHFPLPHPSWRSTGWMRRNPWFETEVLPALRQRIQAAGLG